MEQQIQNLLHQIEHEKTVKILYACESGSRAWGFPSPDSDYDIRFIYLHPREWYLSVNEGTDNLRGIPNELLDSSGWDFRKVLRLLHASNSSVFEWLNSPIIYREDQTFTTELKNLANSYFQPKKVMHHFLGIATGILEKEFQGPTVRIKKYFYVLRPVLAASWIAKNETPPPMDFYELLSLVENKPAVYQAIMQLLKEKETVVEGQLISRSVVLDEFVKNEMERCETIVRGMPRRDNEWEAINDFYRKILNLK